METEEQRQSRMELESFTTYVVNHQELGPTTNPHGLRNNCVFVTMASLMNMSLDKFLNEVETMQPAPNEPGIPVHGILNLLKATHRSFQSVLVIYSKQ